jgi:hypothetical protein
MKSFSFIKTLFVLVLFVSALEITAQEKAESNSDKNVTQQDPIGYGQVDTTGF